MSYDAWGDGDDGLDGYVTEGVAEECFVRGLQAMREMQARFVEQGGDAITATSIRANWNPAWGTDPGKLEGDIPGDAWSSPHAVAKAMEHFHEVRRTYEDKKP